jgi:DNA-binding LacI/PurR family transcriptional regulator
MAHPPTLKEVATSLGVSISTVSRVVNDNPGVHAATRKKIQRVLRRRGYLRNPAAAALKTGRGRVVHVVAESEDHAFMTPILGGTAAVAHEHGYRVLLSTVDYERGSQDIDHRLVDGFVVMPSFEHRVELDWLTRDITVPVVCVYGYATDPRHVSVVSDDEGGARLATAHLVAKGRRRIAYIGGVVGWIQSRQRLAGYKAALEEHGLEFDARLVDRGNWSRESGYAACRRLLERGRPDAVFSANDKMAAGVIHCLRDSGLRIPDDVALVGFDDRDLCQFVTPRLTTIALPLREMGRRAFEVLLGNIEAGQSDGETVRGILRVPCRLVERDSA